MWAFKCLENCTKSDIFHEGFGQQIWPHLLKKSFIKNFILSVEVSIHNIFVYFKVMWNGIGT